MSRNVNLLKFYKENPDFIAEVRNDKVCFTWLCKKKKKDEAYIETVNRFNSSKNITVGPELYKGLTVPRLKIIMALVAQKEQLNFIPSTLESYCNRTPSHFKKRFAELLVPGFWLLGKAIEDSLSEDSNVNYGNPFYFIHGDLGFWWAGVVIMDWYKYCGIKKESCKSYANCLEFYSDPCISRKYKYAQNSALSSLNSIPQIFLEGDNKKNFFDTINRTGQDLKYIKEELESHRKILEKFHNLILD